MKRPYATLLAIFLAGAFALLLTYLAQGVAFPLLAPSGAVGIAERDLMVRTVLLMLIVVVPVFLLIIFMAVHYRAGNKNAMYTPEWENSPMEELVWWSIPFEIVLVLAAITWGATHELDPLRPLTASEAPITIDVVALPWKWLFIYPSEGVASVGVVALPVGHPVDFHITADAPMNSFWIPALGGQEYAMTGMDTELHLMANKVGNYPGRSANYSGDGFAQMTFTAKAMSDADFKAWLTGAHASPNVLNPKRFAELAMPGDAGPPEEFGSVQITFADILAKSMGMERGASGMMDMTMGSTTP